MALPSDRSHDKKTTGQCPTCGGTSYTVESHVQSRGYSHEDEDYIAISGFDYFCPSCGFYTKGKVSR